LTSCKRTKAGNLKVRLDQTLVDRQIADNITSARAMIGAGEIYVDDKVADKPGSQFPGDITIRRKQRCPYVSRGGLKLEKGLSHFQIEVSNSVCVDIGASSGGFTDCLLQHDAAMVYAVDVAYGQLAWKIRQDPRVVVLERFNARHITPDDLNRAAIDLVVMDVSFISLTTLIPPVRQLFSGKVAILALIKPQFELAKNEIGAGGVVHDAELHDKAISKIECFAQTLGLESRGAVPSPILGPKGNREFLIYISS
jgi:23S rRNA (cytidine1920-2'-O)/16S rRNA (cytidine1409-2'-O)-methyltransferase